MIEETPIVNFEGGVNPYEEVDYYEQARGLTTAQFMDKPVFLLYLRLLLSGRDDVQGTLKQLMQERSLDTAVGAQLDIIGEIVGQGRNLINSTINPYFGFEGASGARAYRTLGDTERTSGLWRSIKQSLFNTRTLSDREYRQIIKLKILKNSSQADITAFLDGCRLIFGVERVDYEEKDGQIIIDIGRAYNDTDTAAFPGLDEIKLGERFLNKPLGVLIGYKEPFSFSADFVTQRFRVFDPISSTTGLAEFGDLFTLTRPYEAEYYNSAGERVVAGVNEPRFDHDPVTYDPLGILITPPDEQLTHSWGVEVDDNNGTFTLKLSLLSEPTQAMLAFLTQSSDFTVALYREEHLWKLRVENGVEGDNLVILDSTQKDITLKVSYNRERVSFYIGDSYQIVDVETSTTGSDIEGYDMRIGGQFTTSHGYTYDSFNGHVELLSYETNYTGSGRVVQSPSNLTTEINNILKTEDDDYIMIEGYGAL